MEYIKGKNIISKLMKSAISIGTLIVLLVAIPYIAIFVIKALFFIAVFGVLVWSSLKIVKTIKNFIYKLSTKKNANIQADMSSSDKNTTDSIDINYEDSIIIDVDYEKVE
ncbi:hypothetical protein G9F72_007900 [Clostridium estertheticum]|uniref:hypothetical protein n=1 Tax=Clostridium estertheticum TaxID=238834 RepID=UPI0013E97572|nr:hypothetical protein [Clostridium estertheticum]MBZ9686251.1 hypothetical protein [Clostridium estertheticum]